jgi:anti-sigma factor RsiW
VSGCKKHIQNIADYIDGEIDQALCRQLEEHLRGCNNCRIMVDTMRQTVVLCREGKREELPPEIESKLLQALKQKWVAKFGNPRRR